MDNQYRGSQNDRHVASRPENRPFVIWKVALTYNQLAGVDVFMEEVYVWNTRHFFHSSRKGVAGLEQNQFIKKDSGFY